MGEDCEKCDLAHTKIASLETRVKSLEDFETWAKPILENIIILVNDEKWKKWVAITLASVISYVYVYQIYPSFEKADKNQIETIKLIHEIKNDVIKELTTQAEYTNSHTTKASKTNYKAIRRSMKDELNKRINSVPPISVSQHIGKS